MSNDELLSALNASMTEEETAVAKMVVLLMEVEDRGLHYELAHSSMFDFCQRRLEMSEGEAYRRIAAARLAKRHPCVLAALRTQRIRLSSLMVIRPLLLESPDKAEELIAAISGKSTRAVEALILRLAPKPDVKASIRQLPTSKNENEIQSSTMPLTPMAGASPAVEVAGGPGVATEAPVRPVEAIPPRAQLTPLSETRHKVQFTASTDLRQKLERAQSLMRHRNINGDLAIVVERALELLIAKLEKEKFVATSRPKAVGQRGAERAVSAKASASASASTTAVTAATKREVVQRDQQQCSFVSQGGERCPSRELLEIDHRHPRALGGTNEASNLRVLCRGHNRHAAEQVFGREHIERAIDLRRSKQRPRTPAPSQRPQPRTPKQALLPIP